MIQLMIYVHSYFSRDGRISFCYFKLGAGNNCDILFVHAMETTPHQWEFQS